MKKSLILGSMLFAACFVNAAEYVFDTQESCQFEGGKKAAFKNGAHILDQNCHFWTTKMFKFDPSKKYTVSAEIMTDSPAPYPSAIFCTVYFNDKGRFIQSREYLAAPNGFTELAKAMNPSDTVITIKKPAGFRKHSSWPYVLAFEAKEDKSDLPNPKVTTKIKKMVIGADTITLTVDKPTFASYPAGTKVRLHYHLSFFNPVDLGTYYNRSTPQWQKVTATLAIPKGVKNFKPAVIYYIGKSKKRLHIRNFKLTEE